MNLSKMIFCIIAIVFLFGCATIPKQTSVLTLPKKPPVVVMDNGKFDKKKYPNTSWIKPPRVDLKKGQAWWSFKDVEKISESLTLWPKWGKDVEALIEGQNDLAAGKGKYSHPWWRFW